MTMTLGNEVGVSQVLVTTSDHVTFHAVSDTTSPFAPQLASGPPISYDRFQISIDGDGLSGQGGGVVAISVKCQDSPTLTPVTVDLVGMPDHTAPSLGALPMELADPLGVVNLIASEPLPASTAARLTAAGDAVDLVPNDASVPDAIGGFSTPPGRSLLFGEKVSHRHRPLDRFRRQCWSGAAVVHDLRPAAAGCTGRI